MSGSVKTNGHIISNGHTPKDSNAEDNDTNPVRLKENVTLLYAIAVITSLVVGTGIYLTPQGVVSYTGSVGLSLLVWLLSGIIATFGALCFAELGTTYPGSGAHYVYLEKMYGPGMAFVYLWTMVFLVRPGLNALKALVFAQYVIQPILAGCSVPSSGVTVLASCLVVLLGFINIYDVKLALRGQTVFFLATMLALLIIAATGITWLARGNTEFVENSFEGSSTSLVDFLLALYSGTFAYAGWYCINILTEEMKNPQRILPWALGIAMCLVTTLYLLVNLAYFVVLGPDGILTSQAVAASFSTTSLGVGVWFIALFITINTAGSTNVGIMVASRLCFVGARRGHLPHFLGLIQVQFLSPITAIIFQVILSVIACVFTRDVTWLINQVHAVVLVMDGLVVGGMVYLRWRKPQLKRPFKLPVIIPVCYFLCMAVMTIVPMVTRPKDSALGGVFVVLTALPYYFVVVLWKGKPKAWSAWAKKFTHNIQKLLLCTAQEGWLDT